MEKGVRIEMKDGKRVVEGLGYYETPDIRDLRQIVKESVRKFGYQTAFKFKDKDKNIIGKTYREFDSDIDGLGTALHDMGLKGLRFAVLGENRYEWGVCYLAAINGTGIAVPLDKYLPENEVELLIERGKVDVIFYSPAFHQMMLSISKKNKNLQYYICMDYLEKDISNSKMFMALPDIIKKGRTLLDAGNKSFVDAEIDRTGMSVLLFTSGTTSMAKGVMLSHANIASNVEAITSIVKIYPGDAHLSLLPLHHTFENTVGFLFMVFSGVVIAYCDGIKHITQNLREYDISLLVAVPAILETFHKRVTEGVKKSGKEKALNILIGISEFLRKLGIDLRRKLFKSVFEQFAPKLRLAVSGAAPLDPEAVVWFGKIGFYLIQGYGLTETSPVVAANNDFVNVPGTVGYPLKSVEVAIADPDENGMGEIITRGPNVMIGYYDDPQATSEVLESDGWYHTGDLGIIDEKGFLKITGRAKSMIVLGNGKKAFPEEYEIYLNNIPGVKDSFAWGHIGKDSDVQVCAKIVIDKEYMEQEKVSEEQIAERIAEAVKEINKTLPKYKILRYIIFSYEDLVLTTTLKTKRNIEMKRVSRVIENSGLDMRKLSGKFIDHLVK